MRRQSSVKDDIMRLAHFIQRYPPALGGSEAYFARLGRWCAEHGDEVTVFTSNAVALEAFWSKAGSCLPAGIVAEDGVSVRRYPLWRMPGRRWLFKAMSLVPHRLWQCVTMPCNPIAADMWRDAGTMVGFDAVHASAFPYAFPIVCARRLARRLRVPFFITPFLHLGNPDDPGDRTRRGYTSPALRWLLNEADGVFVQTPSERAMARALGLPAEKIILQGLGVEPRECTGGDRSAARRAWWLPDDAFVVGHLANNSWEKGTNDLLAALEPLWRARRPVHLLLAGPQMPNFTAFWQAFEARCPDFARQYVLRLGVITDDEKRDFYAAIDVFALPSRSDSFGLVLLEAWANGVSNVAYRAGGITDIIRHDIDGLLVSCGDITALGAAIVRLQDDLDVRVRLGMDGKARLPSEFCWDDKLALVRNTIERAANRGESFTDHQDSNASGDREGEAPAEPEPHEKPGILPRAAARQEPRPPDAGHSNPDGR
jgi:glycosyltransferase involved in cell wall biosynthesis